MSTLEVDPASLLVAAGRCAAAATSAAAVRRLVHGDGVPDTGRADDRALLAEVLTNAERGLAQLAAGLHGDAVVLRAAAQGYATTDARAVPAP